MTDDDFEQELKRMARRDRVVLWMAMIPTLAFAIALRGIIWFVVAALAVGCLAWLSGSDNPRDVALAFGWVAVPLSTIWTLVLFVNAIKNP